MIKQRSSYVVEISQKNKGTDYTLLLKEECFSKLRKLAHRYHLTESRIIEVIMKFRFIDLKEELMDDTLFYLEFFFENGEERTGDLYSTRTVKGNLTELLINLPTNLTNVIDIYCHLIHWAPERFIEDAVEFWIEQIEEELDLGERGILAKIFNLKPILTAITRYLEGEKNQ